MKSYRLIQENLEEWRVIFFEDEQPLSSSIYASEDEAVMAGQYYLLEYTGVLPWYED